MKKFKYFVLASIVAFGLTSCGDFGDTNIDPEHLNEGNVPYAMLFSNAQHQVLGSDWDIWRNGCIYAGQWMQHITSIDWWWPHNMFYYTADYSAAYWSTYNSDRGAFRDVTTVLDKWAGDDTYKIDYNMARVLRVYAASRMTDLYGDIPYSQAGRPALYSYPEYDTQQEVYNDMLKELDEAQANLSSGTAVMGSQDLYFQGDAASWKRFANSLMLRLAMRLSKVDQATAKTYAAKALANGLITSNAQNVKLNHSDGVTTNDSSEPYAKIFAHEDKEFFIGKTFLDILQDGNDPRIALICTVCDDPSISVQNSDFQYGNSDPSIQKGLPTGGYSNASGSQWWIGKLGGEYALIGTDGYNYQSHYSVPNRYTYSNPTSPTFIVTYAQTQLLLAEAAYRGWVSGDAQTYFKNGVQAALEQFSQFTTAGAQSLYSTYLTSSAISTYVNAQVAQFSSNPLKAINIQYYINCFCDEYETFANWRRSGYPELVQPANAASYGECATEGGTIPRRFRYPEDESQVNSTNYKAAVSNLSNGDRFDSRMWWDTK